MMSAKLFVFAGAFVHWSGGEMSLPSQEYFAGIGWPSEKAVLVIWIFMVFGGCCCRRIWPPAGSRDRVMANNKFIRAFMAGFYPMARRCKRKFHLQ